MSFNFNYSKPPSINYKIYKQSYKIYSKFKQLSSIQQIQSLFSHLFISTQFYLILYSKFMRNLYFKENIDNQTKISPFQHKSRLKSLKQLRQISTDVIDLKNKYHQHRILEILQKKLVEDNQKLENQQAFDNAKKINLGIKLSKHTQKQQSQKKLTNLKQGNKLFQYFEQRYRKQIPSEKVQRQKVNFIQKQFGEIKTKIKTKQQINKFKITDLKQILRKKYLELHNYQQQRNELDTALKQEMKHKMLAQKMKKSKSVSKSFVEQQNEIPQGKTITMNLRPPSIKERLYIIDDTIHFMKGEITKIQEEIQAINTKETSTAQEWVTFLKLFINSGYYMNNGLDNVLRELKKVNVSLMREDLIAEVLDQSAKSFLLKYYQAFNQRQQNAFSAGGQTKKLEIQRNRIKSNIEVKSLIKDSNLKEIYSNTREAMTNLLKRQSFRKSPEVIKKDKHMLFPKIQTKKQFTLKSSRSNTVENENQKDKTLQTLTGDKMEQFKRQQINRINHVYFGNGAQLENKGKLIKRVLFGFSVK